MQSAKKKGEKMIKKKPDNQDGYYEYARYLQFEKNYSAALENLNKAILIDSGFLDAVQLRAEIYSDMKNYPKAIIDAKEILKKNPNNYKITYLLGRAYYKQFMLEDALKCFEKCAELEPTTVNHREQIVEIKELLLHDGIRPLKLTSFDDIFDVSDINRIKEALEYAPILSEEKISNYMNSLNQVLEDTLDKIIERLIEIMSEDKKQFGINSLSADWGINFDFVAIGRNLKYSSSKKMPGQFFRIGRKSDKIYFLYAQ
jgi:tetratricopeptide (TPR) repeat protein